jgi:hypothetical protein
VVKGVPLEWIRGEGGYKELLEEIKRLNAVTLVKVTWINSKKRLAKRATIILCVDGLETAN